MATFLTLPDITSSTGLRTVMNFASGGRFVAAFGSESKYSTARPGLLMMTTNARISTVASRLQSFQEIIDEPSIQSDKYRNCLSDLDLKPDANSHFDKDYIDCRTFQSIYQRLGSTQVNAN